MDNQSEDHHYPLPGDDEIERASLEAAQRAIRQVAAIQKSQKSIRPLTYWPVLKIAAVVTLVSGLAFFLFYQKQNNAPRTLTVTTKAGEWKRVTLPDGSVAELNTTSHITYPEHFTEGSRDVQLSGEAFFEVKSDPAHPFTVHTGALDVQVLGTSFNVKSYKIDQTAEVTVATGKVSVRKRELENSQPIYLLPGDQVIFDHTSTGFTKQKVGAQEAKNWQQHILSFEFQTLREISAELERVYGVEIELRDKELAEKRFQLKAQNESLANILKLLSISGGGFSYQIKVNRVTIQ